MHRFVVCTSLVCFASAVAAQQSARPDPADPKAVAPGRAYDSAFKDYRPYTDPEIARWREVNDEMGRLNGHIGHVPSSVPPRGPAARAPNPPAHGEHGGRK